MKRHLGQSGFSLMEVMIASAILAIIVGSSLTFLSSTETKDTFRGQVQKTNSCLTEASRIIANIKEKGQSRYRAQFPTGMIIAGDYLYSSGDTDQFTRSTTELGLTFTDRWPTNRPIYASDGAANPTWTIRPHLLIMGYMTTLEAMYNADSAGFCTNVLGRNSYNSLIPAPNAAILNTASYAATSSLRIQPFNTETGDIDCYSTPLHVRPPNVTNAVDTERRRPRKLVELDPTDPPTAAETYLTHPNSASLVVFNRETTARSDIGFLVTATVQYQDRKGNLRSCKVQEKFQYNAQPENSLTLEFEDVDGLPSDDENEPDNMNGTIQITGVDDPPRYRARGDDAYTGQNTPIYKRCDAGDHNRRVTFRMTRTREGSIHMCRNLSTQRTAVAWDGGSTWRIARPSNAAYFPGPTSTYNGFFFRQAISMRQTFQSTELLQHVYWAGKETVDRNTDLFAAGLYYPAGGYYCLGIMGCAGAISGTPSTLDMINNAMPFFPSATYNPGGTVNVNYKQFTEGGGSYRYYIPSDHNADTDTNNKWFPCEQLRNNTPAICGSGNVTRAEFVRSNGSANNRDAFQVEIDNLPGGCEVHIQIAEVDAGYNIKTAEFKEYMQEKTLGNRLCRNSNLLNTRFAPMNPMGEGAWFFACSAEANAAPDCSASTAPTEDCCLDYPMYPAYRAHVNPSNVNDP